MISIKIKSVTNDIAIIHIYMPTHWRAIIKERRSTKALKNILPIRMVKKIFLSRGTKRRLWVKMQTVKKLVYMQWGQGMKS